MTALVAYRTPWSAVYDDGPFVDVYYYGYLVDCISVVGSSERPMTRGQLATALQRWLAANRAHLNDLVRSAGYPIE